MQLFNLDQEKLVSKMIYIYCLHHHNGVEGLCTECSELQAYAQERLSRCPYGNDKPVCSNCRIHCYRKDYKERIITVMRFSGPKIFFYSPVAGIKYLIKKKILDRKYLKEKK